MTAGCLPRHQHMSQYRRTQSAQAGPDEPDSARTRAERGPVGAGMARPSAGRRTAQDRLLATILFVLTALLYALNQQQNYWSDGRELLLRAEHGAWAYNKPLYLPAFHLLHAVRAPFGGASVSASLLWLSHLASAAATAWVFLTARQIRVHRTAALCAALLFGLAPGVLFHSTTIEVHTLQLLAAAGVTHWIVRAHQSGELCPDALKWSLALAALGLTHPTGWFWAPAILFVLVEARRRGQSPGRLLAAALFMLALGATLWFFVPRINPDTEGSLAKNIADPTEWLKILREFSLALLALWIPALFGAVRLLRDPQSLRRLPWRAACIILLATYVPLLLMLQTNEQGAYLFSLLPAFALFAGVGLQASKSLLILGFALLPLQFGFGYWAIHQWAGSKTPAWVTELNRELGRSALVLCGQGNDQQVIRHQSHALAQKLTPAFMMLAPEQMVTILGIVPPAPHERQDNRGRLVGDLHDLFHGGHPGQLRLVVTRSLWETATPQQREWLDGMDALLGEPRAEGSPEYLVYPPIPGK